MKLRVGVLAYHGDVFEHILATTNAAKKLKFDCDVVGVRTKKDLEGLDGLIIPGGESTNFYKLLMREGMFGRMKKIPNIFGTCAGAIMLAKKIHNSEAGQRTLELMDIEIDRNAYGRQADSFEQKLNTKLGTLNAVFIRAPRIKLSGRSVVVLAERNGETVACEQKTGGAYYLAACFHPELTTTKFHERFLRML
jgi:5'-phosphate synthase pdxT subunit